MEDNKNELAPEENIDDKDCDDSMIFKDVDTKKRVDKHMSDPHDQITEEDIANVKTDVTPNTIVKPCADAEDDDDSKGDDGDSKTDNVEGTGSPWTLLNG